MSFEHYMLHSINYRLLKRSLTINWTKWLHELILLQFHHLLFKQSITFSAIFKVANVKSNIDCDISECDVYVILFEILMNSHLNRLSHEINSFARIEFWIFEFHHEWCALKSSQIIAFSEMFIDVNFRSIEYFWFSSWDFSF